jgi:tetratricopeptide (TPR) repeat protein
MDAKQIGALCAARGWSRTRLIAELRRTGREHSITLPGDESLRRMMREWVSGRRGLSEFYAGLFTAVFGVPFTSTVTDGTPEVQISPTSDGDGPQGELVERLDAAAAVDAELVGLLEAETQNLRLLDRQLGARRLLDQAELHLHQITDMLTYCVAPGAREPLAAAAAAVASLAGWQALDLGDPDKAWKHHEIAKTVARDSGRPTITAHVTAQQGYALIDVERGEDAVALMQHARQDAGTSVPAVLQSWLWAAEAEAHASIGDERAALRALDEASRLLPSSSPDTELPYVVLDETHLHRWRGHCLARLGATEAIDELSTALATLDPTFTRASAALYCDLAVAWSARGEHDAAYAAAKKSRELAARTASVRQQRRLARLLVANGSGRPAKG